MFGSHISIEKTLADTCKVAKREHMDVIQIFLGSPYTPTRRVINKDDINNVNTNYKDINLFVHCPYIYNLAGSVKNKTLAWNNHQETDEYILKCVKSMEQELQTLDDCKCNCKGCVLHIGSIGGTKPSKTAIEDGCKRVAQSINKIEFKGDTPLCLETMVGNGGVLGKTFEELAMVYKDVQDKEHIGFCIDTCHIFANGTYNVSKCSEIDRMFEDFSRVLPLNQLKCFHLNDSLEGFKSNKDRHQLISQGEIWKSNQDSLIYLCKQAKSKNIPVILETSPSDYKNLEYYMKQI